MEKDEVQEVNRSLKDLGNKVYEIVDEGDVQSEGRH